MNFTPNSASIKRVVSIDYRCLHHTQIGQDEFFDINLLRKLVSEFYSSEYFVQALPSDDDDRRPLSIYSIGFIISSFILGVPQTLSINRDSIMELAQTIKEHHKTGMEKELSKDKIYRGMAAPVLKLLKGKINPRHEIEDLVFKLRLGVVSTSIVIHLKRHMPEILRDDVDKSTTPNYIFYEAKIIERILAHQGRANPLPSLLIKSQFQNAPHLNLCFKTNDFLPYEDNIKAENTFSLHTFKTQHIPAVGTLPVLQTQNIDFDYGLRIREAIDKFPFMMKDAPHLMPILRQLKLHFSSCTYDQQQVGNLLSIYSSMVNPSISHAYMSLSHFLMSIPANQDTASDIAAGLEQTLFELTDATTVQDTRPLKRKSFTPGADSKTARSSTDTLTSITFDATRAEPPHPSPQGYFKI